MLREEEAAAASEPEAPQRQRMRIDAGRAECGEEDGALATEGVPAAPVATPSPEHRSWLWGFFSTPRPGSNAVKCLLCLSSVKFFRSTSNLQAHMQSVHSWALEQAQGPARTFEGAKTIVEKESARQLTIKRSFSRVRPSDVQQVSVELALAAWAVENGIPWRAFNSPSWKAVLEKLGATNIVLGDTLRTRVFRQLFMLVRDSLKERLRDTRAVAATSDGWSRRDISLVSFTVSWTDAAMTVNTVPIAAMLIRNATSDEILARWEGADGLRTLLPEEVAIGAMTTDSGANFRCAARQYVGEGSSWPCFCHSLNNICSVAMQKCDTSRLFKKIEDFVVWVNDSPKRRIRFRELQQSHGLAPKALVKPVVTRWFSKLLMAERYLELVRIVRLFASELSKEVDISSMVLSSTEDNSLRDIISLLHPFYDTATLAEAERSPTLCHVPHWLDSLRRHIAVDEHNDSSLIKHWKQTIAATDQWQRLVHSVFDTVSLPLRAACFHPKYGSLPWISDGLRNNIWLQLAKDAEELHLQMATLFGSSSLTLAAALQQLRNAFEDPATRSKISNFDNDVLGFWRTFGGEFPKQLVDLARFFLSIQVYDTSFSLTSLFHISFLVNSESSPRNGTLHVAQASNTASERLWSSTTFTTKRHPATSASNLEATVVLRGWMQQPGFRFDELAERLAQLASQHQAH